MLIQAAWPPLWIISSLSSPNLVCLVGDEFKKALAARPSTAVKWFASSEDLAAWLKENPVSGMTILVKGSRGIQMEKTLPEL